ncbi:phospholipase D-like domain-containing protein [Olleya namhaensis]|uniref:PLD-like domain-containing protein n=1 Tax=Olleya namhaensis TaxID=1144750 RepID=A0A1I3PQC0_9FLAO|nr:hypothetical protein [Olleya namhaensis]SFJ23758.1 hypothetical protein SAMN05443431_105224 [Olleya namhaensis]
MKFIPPLEIASKIMTLIEESEKELILVSPYVELSNWNKMKKCIDRAILRGVKITFIARKNAKQNLSFLKRPEINLILVNDLHAKLYLNDNYAIVTSQNIVYYSDVNSIDIAYKTENTEQRLELIEFINKYVVKIEEAQKKTIKILDSFKKTIKIIDETIEYDTKFLTADELDKLSFSFNSTYSDTKFVTTKSYVFSKHLIPFSDIMIASVYTVKAKKSNNENIEDFIKEILGLNLNLKNNFNLQFTKSHSRFYYIYFAPEITYDIDGLISDFKLITNAILESEYKIKQEIPTGRGCITIYK